MKRYNVRFYANGVQHIYQRASDKGTIFLTRADRLVFFTMLVCIARKYGVKICAVALMFTHFHLTIIVESKQVMEKFMQDLTSSFARSFNNHYKRSGRLFKENYGWTSKVGDKKIRENLAYVYNNHVEKKLGPTALKTRWNFLAYYVTQTPFSQPLDPFEMSSNLRRSLEVVKRKYDDGKFLRYKDIENLFMDLKPAEIDQLTDCIISKYNSIDYQMVVSFYGSFDKMCMAFDSNTGAEHDINEEYNSESDLAYIQLLKCLKEDGLRVEDIYLMKNERKVHYAKSLLRRTGASNYQIARFLHIEDAD